MDQYPCGELLGRAKLARERSVALCERSERLTRCADTLISHTRRLSGERATLADDTATPVNRPCPRCAKPLEWLERGTIRGSEYDYYRWCFNGRGLYCHDRRVEKWVKVA